MDTHIPRGYRRYCVDIRLAILTDTSQCFVWTLTAGNTCSGDTYRRYCVDTRPYLLFSGIHRQGVSQLAILTVQWDASPGAIVGTVWTLTAGNTYYFEDTYPSPGAIILCGALCGHSQLAILTVQWDTSLTVRGYRRYCVDTLSWPYLLFSGIHRRYQGVS